MFETFKVALIIFAIITNFLIGLIALKQSYKNVVNRVIALFAWVFALWSLSLFFYDYPIFFDSFFWIKITYLIVVFGIIGLLYYFSFIFPTGQDRPPIWGQWAFFISSSLFGISIVFTDWFVKDVVKESWGYATTLGPLYLLFNLFSSVFGFWGLGKLIKKYRLASGYTKAQLKYMFLGLTFFVITVLILDSILPQLTGNSRFFSISTAGSLFFVGFTSYAIIKHRLLDIRLIIGESVIYLLLTIIISALCFLGALIYWYATNTPVKIGVIFITTIVSAILVLIYERLKRLARTIARKYLFQSIYDYQKTLLDLSTKLSSYLEMPKLVDLIINTLIKTMRLNRVAVLVKDPLDNHYKIQKTVGFDEDNGIGLVKDNFLTSYLEKNPQVIVLEEIIRLSQESQYQSEREGFLELGKHMKRIEASLITPVINAGKLISLLVLGNKISSDSYTVQDINLLTTIASQASIAIENARLYKEIQEFTKNLEQKVKSATAEIQKRNKLLEDANIQIGLAGKVKNDLLTMASHEFRTPLTIINNALWFLNKDEVKQKLEDKERQNLEKIAATLERLNYVVKNMNQMLQTTSGNLDLELEPTQIEILIKEVVEDKQTEAFEKQIKVEYLEPKELLPEIVADKIKLKYIFWELVTNALKYGRPQGKVTIETSLQESSLQIKISDTGLGIPEKDLPNLFESFKKLDILHTTQTGMGLGLYIVKKIITLHGGEIKVESKEGAGTTFTISLPIKELAEINTKTITTTNEIL